MEVDNVVVYELHGDLFPVSYLHNKYMGDLVLYAPIRNQVSFESVALDFGVT